MNKTLELTTAQAKEKGYEAITHPYSREEQWMLDAAIKQLGDADHCVIVAVRGKTLCRKFAK